MAEAEAISLDARWRKICAETLTLVCRNKDAWIFKDPVIESPELSHEAKVAYSSIIPNPMDFATIRKNMAALESPAEFESDMLLVFRNCATFNKPGQDAFEMGRDVENVFLAKWELERRKEIATALYERSIELARSVRSDILVTSKRKAKRNPPFYDAVNRKVVYEPASSSSGSISSPGDWRELMVRFYEDQLADPQMAWFAKPVHKYPAIPTEVKKSYYAVIRFPMDLETVGRNINLYPSPAEFRKDMELIVTNSVRFNPPGSPVNVAALELQNRITKAFQDPILLTAANSLPRDWKAKKVGPETPPPEVAAPAVPGPTVLRLKRGRKEEDGVEKESVKPVTGADSVAPVVKKPTTVTASTPMVDKSSQILSLERPMTPPPLNVTDWRHYATHLLNELSAIKDDSGTKLSWIFQRPIFKYDLPPNIKRLYLLSIGELMDMGVIQAKLAKPDSGYSPSEFETDVELMLDNCLVFNDETQYPHKVAFVVQKHYWKYWKGAGGLGEKAHALWSTQMQDKPAGASSISGETPNWAEIRQQAAAVADPAAPVKDCDSVTGTYPLNEELLYEWRVSQRYVMHKLRKTGIQH